MGIGLLITFLGAGLLLCVQVLILWPFVLKATGGPKQSSLKMALIIQIVCGIMEMIVYNFIGASVFERIFSQDNQLAAKLFYHMLLGLLSTGISIAILRKTSLRSIAWLLAGQMLIAFLVLIVMLPLEM